MIVQGIVVYMGRGNMPIIIDGQTYYRALETCRIVGISKNTLFRWVKRGMLGEAEYRDWRGWRLFNENQVNSLRTITKQVVVSKKIGPKSSEVKHGKK
jgi:hypothetical protein